MVADRWPQEAVPQRGWIEVEHRSLIFRVEAGIVSVVPEHQPKIGRAVCSRETIIGFPHRTSVVISRARIAQSPESEWPPRASPWRSYEPVIGPRRKPLGRAAEGIKGFRIRTQS